MTLKLIGAAMIIFSSWAIGVAFSMKSTFRMEDLEELKKAVTVFIGDTVNVSMPLSAVFEDISKRVNGPVAMVFDSAREIAALKSESCAEDIFNIAVEKNAGSLLFEPEDMECLYSFAKNLDCGYKSQQQDNARLLLENIKLIQLNINEKAQKEKRLYNSAGILCGVLTCVILL